MIIGTLILDLQDRYVSDDGRLPTRPNFDKVWLSAMVENSLISKEGFDTLPLGMQKLATITHGRPTLCITIPEIGTLANILIVTRSYEAMPDGKVFRLEAFEEIAKSGQFVMYKRKKINK